MKTNTRLSPREGFVLVAVVVVIALMALTSYSLAHWLALEADTTSLEGRRLKTAELARSGAELVLAVEDIRRSKNSPTAVRQEDWSQRADWLQGALVDPSTSPKVEASSEPRGRVTILSPMPSAIENNPNGAQAAFLLGTEPEGGKIHLNAWMSRDPEALRRALLALPGADETIVDSILDWLDTDDEARASGAESEYYKALSPPLAARNGPLESIDELLLVQGVTKQLLMGEDANGNGVLDPNENDGDRSPPLDDQDGQLDRGWRPFLTLDSQESNLDQQGIPRIFLNDPDVGRVYSLILREFDEELARLVLAYRVLGAPGSAPFAPSSAESTVAPASGAGPFHLPSPFVLIDLDIAGMWEGHKVELKSPFRSNDRPSLERFRTVVDRWTTNPFPTMVGRVDLHSASPAALELLPLTPEQRRRILEERLAHGAGISDSPTASTGPSSARSAPSILWLLEENIVTLRELIALDAVVAASSPTRRFQSVGFLDPGRPATRLEFLMDRSAPQPRILCVRPFDQWGEPNLSFLGQGADPKPIPEVKN